MLVLSRKQNESIMIGDSIEVVVLEIRGDQVKIGTNAPKDIKVYRKEIYLEIQKENVIASKSLPESISKIGGLIKKKY